MGDCLQAKTQYGCSRVQGTIPWGFWKDVGLMEGPFLSSSCWRHHGWRTLARTVPASRAEAKCCFMHVGSQSRPRYPISGARLPSAARVAPGKEGQCPDRTAACRRESETWEAHGSYRTLQSPCKTWPQGHLPVPCLAQALPTAQRPGI